MKFNPKARIDQGQYSDAGRGSGGSSAGMRLPIPGGGGGRLTVGGVVIAVVVFFVTQLLSNGSSGDGDTTECRTGADANGSDKCATALLGTSVQDYWEKAYAGQVEGELAFEPRTFEYQPARITTFSAGVDTGCGQAGAEMGPFYCPNDLTVYVADNFMKDMLEGDLHAEGGPFALGYVVAHEYGHHIENLLGYLGRMQTQRGEKSDSVKAELMADCLGGMWAKNAQETVDEDGNVIIEDLTEDDIARAIDAATAVGDDRIQPRASKES
ncbi:MAG: peptidase, partial [Microbacterium sp.]